MVPVPSAEGLPLAGRLAEIRRTASVVLLAVSALFSFIPFGLNLLGSLFLGGRFRRRVRSLMESADTVPVDEASRAGRAGTVYFLAGEDSGDLHAARLAAAIREKAPEVDLRGMGGPRMEANGCRLDFELARMNVMGVLPVIRSFGTFFGLFRRLLRMLETDPPDVLVPVDYPGFNMRVARAARRRGVTVVYYIAPQVWAWAPWRIRRIAKSVDRMLAILPFEKELFESRGVDCSFVGHPLYEHLEDAAPAGDPSPARSGAWSIGLLPGSRRAEVRGVLPQMARAAVRVREAVPDAEFVIPFRRSDLEPEIRAILAHEAPDLHVRLVRGKSHEVMRDLDLALVASGTASLELAYYRVPMVVLYRIGRLSAVLKRIALITPHVALVNIVAGNRIVPEFVGPGDYSEEAAGQILRWVNDEEERSRILESLSAVRSRLLFAGVADRAAGWVLERLPERESGSR